VQLYDPIAEQYRRQTLREAEIASERWREYERRKQDVRRLAKTFAEYERLLRAVMIDLGL
jgi:phosphopantetheinyl transferase (holo-ACP synthase)